MTTCLDCQKPFTVSPEEQAFIKKVSPVFQGKVQDIPEPTLCPDCRLRWRVSHRNEQFFHMTKSAFSGQELLSLYPATSGLKVVSNEEWWSDQWDGLDYGQDFDFNRPFFEQFQELLLKIPRANLMQVNNENSPYTTGTGYCKNCYLINSSENCENCYYGKLLQSCRDVIDSSYCYDSELATQCFNVENCYNCQYVYYSQNCTDCAFSENLRGCRSCFLCTNLQNKEFYFLNQPLSKEEYQAKVKECLGSQEKLQEVLRQFEELRQKRIHKYANIVNCEESTGDFLTGTKNCQECFDVNDSQDCRYVHVGVEVKDIMDCSNMYLKPELCYQVMGSIGIYQVLFSIYVFHSQEVLYSQFCFNSMNLFGCAGLRKNQYCIFNKQYTPEAYEEMVNKIIEHMKKTGEWAYFFPGWMSPIGYNESLAQEYLPLSREQALAKHYKWQEPDPKDYKPQTYTTPDAISQVSDEVLKEILACELCQKNYKIIPQELRRLREVQLPLPRRCPDCRHRDRMKLRNPRMLYDRSCGKCGQFVQSSYSPEQPELIYCEKCYLGEM